MNYLIVTKYINKLTKQDIINYANKEKINLTNKEIDTIYTYIKTRYNDFFYNDKESLLKEIKNQVSTTTYQKIEELYNQYKNKI